MADLFALSVKTVILTAGCGNLGRVVMNPHPLLIAALFSRLKAASEERCH